MNLTRGPVKQALIRLGYPVRDLGGYVDGDPLEVRLRDETLSGAPFALREYQDQAATAFHADGGVTGGNGVIVLPCGAGKTVTAMAAISRVGAKTLILTTNTVAVRQWRNELIDKTYLTEDQVGEYTGDTKRVGPVTVSTYQMLTFRKGKTEGYKNLDLFREHNWGLVVYDEVHLLPAPVFRMTAELQARRRLGLTATLVREDGKEEDVFCLIGPKRFELPWKQLEAAGFIATAALVEIRVPLNREGEAAYRKAGGPGPNAHRSREHWQGRAGRGPDRKAQRAAHSGDWPIPGPTRNSARAPPGAIDHGQNPDRKTGGPV